MTFGEKLKYLREEILQLTQEELADRLTVSQATLSALEKETNKSPSFDLFKKLVQKYHVNPMYFLSDDEKEPPILKHTKGIYLPFVNKISKYERLIDEMQKVRNGR